MEAPKCGVCGKREWGHVCGISGGDLSAKVTGRGQPEEPVRHEQEGTREDNRPAKTETISLEGQYAPHGECGWCDRRRANEAARQRRIRAKGKGG